MHFIVKNTTFPSPFDLLAPHSCRGCHCLGTPLCEHCKKYIIKSKSDFCPQCKAKITSAKCPKCKHLPPIYFIGARTDLLNQIIQDYKYHSVRSLAKPLAELLDAKLPHNLPQSVIVPLPTSTNHIRSRGIDHTYLIAKHLAKLRHLNIQPVLIRKTNTTQVGSSHTVRLAQAKQAYQINPHITIDPGLTYILFDDIWTTGASMLSAVKKLQQAGAKHIIIALLAISRLD